MFYIHIPIRVLLRTVCTFLSLAISVGAFSGHDPKIRWLDQVLNTDNAAASNHDMNNHL